MTAAIPFNYLPTTVAGGTFNAASTGYVQGAYLDDPSTRFLLAGGVLANTETLPMWGGVAINETVNPNGAAGALVPAGALGGLITRATNVTANAAGSITGFSVFNQAYGMAITPQSPVPMAPSFGQVNFFRLGSNARIAVACDPALVSLETGSVNQLVSWDFSGQQLIPYAAAYADDTITAASWANTAGGQATLTLTTGGELAVGDVFTISGVTPAAYNGTFVAITGTAGTTLKYALPLASTPGAGTAFGKLVAGGGALKVLIIEVQASNSMTIVYNSLTGNATWNYQGTIAIIQLIAQT